MGSLGFSAGVVLRRSSSNVPGAWLIVGVALLDAGGTLAGAELSLLQGATADRRYSPVAGQMWPASEAGQCSGGPFGGTAPAAVSAGGKSLGLLLACGGSPGEGGLAAVAASQLAFAGQEGRELVSRLTSDRELAG